MEAANTFAEEFMMVTKNPENCVANIGISLSKKQLQNVRFVSRGDAKYKLAHGAGWV